MENKIALKIGTPVAIVTKLGIVYDVYYYLGNGVIGRMYLPYNPNDLLYIPSFNVFKEDWIKYVVPCKDIETFKRNLNDLYLKGNIADIDDLDNCLYAKENFSWWNDKQKDEIKSYY